MRTNRQFSSGLCRRPLLDRLRRLIPSCHLSISQPSAEGRNIIRPREADVYVSSVCWSPTTRPAGELAVALGDCTVLLSEDETSSCSFCWMRTAMLMQSMKVEAIQWTGSGDGIISGGTEVVTWRRNEKHGNSFVIKTKSSSNSRLCHLVCHGLSATAPWSEVQIGNSSSIVNDARECVFVYQFDGHSNYTQTELHHPMPVRMIQWRPSIGKPSSRHAPRPVL